MSRKTDLEKHVRASSRLIREYEEILQYSKDPQERARAERAISEQRKLIRGHLHEYAALAATGTPSIPDDIREVAAGLKAPLPAKPPAAGPDAGAHEDARAEPTQPGTPAPAQPSAPAAPPVRRALIIGVGKYRQLRPLTKTTTDARDLYDLLLANGYAPGNCTLLLDDDATRGIISDKLDKLARKTGPEDTVLVFFSGHGAQRIGGFEPGEYLCPVEADWYNLRATAISDGEFTTALRALNAARLLVLMDACHSGGVGEPRDAAHAIRPGLSETAYAQMAAGKGRVLIASCQPDEVSWELNNMRNDLFTHYLLEGLRGAAADPDRVVRVLRLFDYLSQQVPTRMSQHPLMKAETAVSFPVTWSSDT